MMYIHVDNNSVSLLSLLTSKSIHGSLVTKQMGYNILVGVCKGLQYIHSK